MAEVHLFNQTLRNDNMGDNRTLLGARNATRETTSINKLTIY